jgi:hypothetical protein
VVKVLTSIHLPITDVGSQFSLLKSVEINDLEEPEKYNNLETK